MNEYNFVYMTDESFAMPTAVAVKSLIEHKSPDCSYNINIILDDVSDYSVGKLREVECDGVIISFHKVDAKRYDAVAKSILVDSIHVPRTDMLKFELPNYLSELDEVLYVDGDIIMNKCIEPLFDTDISEHYVASVDDMGDRYDEQGISWLANRIGFPSMHYFNAGFMYLNLKRMREDGISEKLWEYRKNGKNYFMSQDALNYVLRDGRVSLPYKYNFRSAIVNELEFDEINSNYFNEKYENITACIEDQTVIHMTDRMKPWDYNMPWFTEIFIKYYEISPYSGQKLYLKSPIKKKSDMVEEVIWNIFVKNIEPDDKVILYGAGSIGRRINTKNKNNDYCDIVLWVDGNPRPGICVVSPQNILGMEFDKVVVAISQRKMALEIREMIVNMGVDKSKILVLG